MTVTIFLASSKELAEDRTEFKAFINDLNESWNQRGIAFKVESWENFIDSLSKDGLQKEYNKAAIACDIFLMLFFTKVGKYTEEEFEAAFKQQAETNRPRIYTYVKEDYILTGQIGEEIISLIKFKIKLSSLGHYTSTYTNIDNLKWQFSRQLEKLYGDPLRNQGKTDSDVINFVCKYLSPIADENILRSNDLTQLIKGTSDFGKNVVFQLAKVNRRSNRQRDPQLMARSIPIFQALVDSKLRPQQEDHKYFGQLAYALKDQDEREADKIESFKKAKALLDQAIEIRDIYDTEYFYEFNRAICTVHIETAPNKEQIIKDLSYAIPGIRLQLDELWKEIDNRKLKRWIEENEINIHQL